MKFFKTILLFVFFISIISFGQNNYKKEYIEIIPGAQYKAGSIHNFFFGKHWRNIWATPIKVEILNLNKFAGGLIPLKRGGGFQTKSLRLMGKDKHIWKFRSMDKDPSKVLPKVLRETFVADIFQDQISSSNPLAALIAAPILTELGILQAKPYLVYMPDDPKLNEFRKDFGGVLGMIEIHPDVNEDLEFKGANKIKSTYKLFDRLAEKRNEKVNDIDYLKARLVDALIGDWDRHTDQWKWARYKMEDKSFWEPIPRDRDQVFAKWDGVGPSIAEYYTPQFVHFDYEYPEVEKITWSGRYIDRRFLTEITKAECDSIANFIKNKLTDAVIENAVKILPIEHFKIAGNEIIEKLKSRRDLLPDFATEYYNLINKVVDIYGTNKDDILSVNRINDSQTSVTIYSKKKRNSKKMLLYHKVFDNSITKEIRVFLLDGDDKTIITGDVDDSPLVRVIGGKGKDKFTDNSKVNGCLLNFLPIPYPERKTEFYDSGKKTKVKKGASTYFNDEKYPEAKTYTEKYEPKSRNRGSTSFFLPSISYNSSDGLRIGSGIDFYKYNFRMVPYEYYLKPSIVFSTKPKSFSFEFSSVFNSLIRGGNITLNISRSALLFTQFYGFGNETTYKKQLDKSEFYRLDQELFKIQSAVYLNFFGNVKGGIGMNYRYSNLKPFNKELLNSFQSKYGLNNFKLLEFFANFNFDLTDNKYYPRNGFYGNFKYSTFLNVLSNKKTFHKIEGDAAFFTTLYSFTEFTLSFRAGGGIVFGDYPFFQSIFLGGIDNLRGYTRRRFAGDAGIFGQFELRTLLFPLKIIVPGKLGFHSLIETGRVFDDIYVDSQKWHSSYGGGLWFSFIDDSISFSVTIAGSSETIAKYFSIGMNF
ncbi:MAG: hypothetical protein CR986_07130 [Ignavibacteriae bacterium]|nr:MAG: hypothetical protein CR986_07130 [Ignavibacteriota bacterium]